MLSFKYLSMAFRKSGKPGQDVCLILFFGGGESFETNSIVYFVFVMVDCILVRMPLFDLSLKNLDVVLQLGKIVASIEQKPVSLNDIVTYGALIKNERDY